jgi:hypothetical protein
MAMLCFFDEETEVLQMLSSKGLFVRPLKLQIVIERPRVAGMKTRISIRNRDKFEFQHSSRSYTLF